MNIVKVMGRNCGYLALTAGIVGGAEVVANKKPLDLDLLELARVLSQ